MSDQMPDEVWIESSFNNDPNWPGFEREVYVAEDGLIPGDAVRYIRADLMDETTQCYTASARGLQRQLVEQQKRADQAEAERDALRQQAEGWAQEARAQRATVHECYQACTGATGEPGDWHGAEPVRAVVAERDRLRAALERLMRGEGGVNSLEQERIVQEALNHD